MTKSIEFVSIAAIVISAFAFVIDTIGVETFQHFESVAKVLATLNS